MRRARLGRTHREVSAVSLGTWGHGGPRTVRDGDPVGWSGHDDGLAVEAMLKAWNGGIDHWDTADAYGDGHAEMLIGSVWDRVPRERIFLASKVGWVPGPHDHYYDPGQMRIQLERSLTNLRTDRIDLYYLHHCDFGEDDRHLEGAIEQMRRFRDEGKIRFIGLSDWNASKILRYADRVDPDVVQPFRNVIDDDYASSGLQRWVEEHDIGVAFFSPLKHGLLLGKYEEPPEFPEGDFRVKIPEFRDREFIRHMRDARHRVEERFGDHPHPVLHAVVGALLSDAPDACVLLGQRNPDQAEAAATVGELLSAEDAAWIRRLYRGEL